MRSPAAYQITTPARSATADVSPFKVAQIAQSLSKHVQARIPAIRAQSHAEIADAISLRGLLRIGEPLPIIEAPVPPYTYSRDARHPPGCQRVPYPLAWGTSSACYSRSCPLTCSAWRYSR